MPNPAAIIGYEVARREPLTSAYPSTRSYAERNVRPPLRVFPQEAPEPPRQGDIPARTARWPIIVFQSVADWLSVDQWHWETPLWAPTHTADTTTMHGGYPYDSLSPWAEKSNIRRDPSIAYGSIFELSQDEQKQLLLGKAG